jgi:hypothetical protein
MILISQWYEPEDAVRCKELLAARRENERSPLFLSVLYVEGKAKRWTYGEMFDLAAAQFSGEVVVVANTDITFGDGCDLLPTLCRERRLIALTCWDEKHSPRMLGHQAGHRFFSGSQDCWVFIGGQKPNFEKPIPLGNIGCENALVGAAVKSGWEVFNPAIDIVTRHHHDGERPPRASELGHYYGYPHLTTVECSGLVLCHEWPLTESDPYAKVIETCRT